MQQKTLHQGLLSGSFAYNIRGWLTSIASPVFNEQLYYQEAQSGQTPCYNGNISSLSWGYCGRTDKAYSFSYDQLNRLTEAVYSPDDRYNEEVEEYDLNGNIKSLLRSGYVHDGISMDPMQGYIDDLTYQYEGNRLVRVEDNVGEESLLTSNDFKDADSSVEYLYDACGNMTGDFNRGIAWIKYNCLHLPYKIQFSNGNKSSYAYDATGMKRSVQHAFSLSGIQIPFGADTIENTQSIQSLSQTDYCGNFIYEDAQLSRILTPEGYIETTDSTGSTANTGNWRFSYFLKDHLGNVRARIACPNFSSPIPSSAPSSPPTSPAYTLLDTTDYYPFGLEISSPEGLLTSGNNPYLYNGKELDRMHGLNMYDYGARMYDASLGRWNNIDLLAINYIYLSPYNYALNNPIRFIDPDGYTPKDVINKANSYIGYFYEWGGKDPASKYSSSNNPYPDGISSVISKLLRMEYDYTGFDGKRNYYKNLGLNVESGKSFGIDCSGLARIAFNADPDKLMADLPSGRANDQMKAFEKAETLVGGFSGELDDDIKNTKEGDLVFMLNSKGVAKHVMIATGEIKVDKDGKVTHIKITHAPDNGEKVVGDIFYEIKKDIDYRIGHTYRKDESTSWSDFLSWISANNLWDKIKGLYPINCVNDNARKNFVNLSIKRNEELQYHFSNICSPVVLQW